MERRFSPQDMLSAQLNFKDASNLFSAMASGKIAFRMVDLIRAYRIAEQWITWFNSYGDIYSSQSSIIQNHLKDLQRLLTGHTDEVRETFEQLSPQMLNLIKDGVSADTPSATKLYAEALRSVAKFFEQRGFPEFMQKIS